MKYCNIGAKCIIKTKYAITLALTVPFLILLLLAWATPAKAQEAPSKKTEIVKPVPIGQTFDLDKADEIETSNKAILKGVSYKVYATSKGKLFIKLISPKTGKPYRRYLKTV